MRTAEVFEALAGLEARATRRGAFRQFRALGLRDPQAPQETLRKALSGIEQGLGAGFVFRRKIYA